MHRMTGMVQLVRHSCPDYTYVQSIPKSVGGRDELSFLHRPLKSLCITGCLLTERLISMARLPEDTLCP